MVTTVAPNPLIAPQFQEGMTGRGQVVAPVPATMSPQLRAQRQAASSSSSRTMAPIAYAQQQYQEPGDPFTAFASGWVNAGSQREAEAAETAKREANAAELQAYPDLVKYVSNGTMDMSDALRIKETRDGSAATEQRRGEIGDYLTQLAGTDERYSQLARAWGSNAMTEEDLSKALVALDDNANGSAGEETFAMQPTYYEIPDPATGEMVVRFGQMGSKGTFKPTELPEGARPAVPVTQLNTETGFTPVDRYGRRPDDAVETPINNQDAAYDTGIGRGQAEIDVAMPEKKRKAAGALSALERQQQLVAQDIDRAVTVASDEGITGLFATGFLGDLSSAVRGTPAYDLSQTLLTIKANIGFDRLQEMRNNSPTGGALGAISDKETALLQAVNGALEQGQSREQFVANLQRIKELQAEVLAERQQAFSSDFGDGSSQSSNGTNLPSPDANGGAVGTPPDGVDPELWQYMTPEERAAWQN